MKFNYQKYTFVYWCKKYICRGYLRMEENNVIENNQ